MSDEETQVSRREFVHTGLQLGAALGVSGLGGLTIVGEAGAQTKRQYPWESLPAGETVPPTKLQLRTIGLGVSVQDRFLREAWRFGAGPIPPGVRATNGPQSDGEGHRPHANDHRVAGGRLPQLRHQRN